MPRWSTLRGAIVALVAVAAVVGWAFVRPGDAGRSEPQGDGDPRALRAEPSAGAPATEGGQGGDPPRVLIFGDSIADQAGSSAAFALEQVGIETEVMTLWGQGLFAREEYDLGVSNPNPPDGTMMAAASHAVAEFDPDVVAVYTNHNYWPPYPRDAAGHEIELGSPAFDEMARTQLAELTRRLSARGAAVYLVEPAPGRPGEGAADNPIWASYQAVRRELGLGVLTAGRALASPSGTWVDTLPDCRGEPLEVRPGGDLHLTYFGAGRMGTELARQLAGALGVPPGGIRAPAEAPVAMLPLGDGYRLVTCDGATFAFGSEASSARRLDLGADRPAGDPVVAATAAPPGDRAWAVTVGGRVLEAGGAPPIGDAALRPGERAVGIAATDSGEGYWVATSRGRVQAFGDAEELEPATSGRGGADGAPVAADAGAGNAGAGAADADPGGDPGPGVVAMAGTPDHRGYWLLHASGRVEAFGTARHLGDLRSERPDAPLAAIAPHPDGDGYWILDRGGGVHGFGSARSLGSAGNQPLVRLGEWRSLSDHDTEPVPPASFPTSAVALLPTETGDGYWVWLANGAMCRFGDARAHGSIHRAELDQVMLFLGLPYYGEGPCRQDVGFGGLSEAQIDAGQEAGDAPLGGSSPRHP